MLLHFDETDLKKSLEEEREEGREEERDLLGCLLDNAWCTCN